MKAKIFFIAVVLFVANTIFGQVPQGTNYQAIARNPSGAPLQNRQINVRFSIHQGSSSGSIVYQETDTSSTNQFGQFTTIIGNGIATVGTFANINWATGNKYLEVELDPNGGQSFSDMGNSELMSVPYALYAQTAGGGNNTGFSHYIGQLYGGGIVVAVWKDTSGAEHGLVASLIDVAMQVPWSDVNTLVGAPAESGIDGAGNTAAIIAQAGQTSSAALACKNYNGGGYSDWYLPSIMELNQCCISAFIVNQVLGSNGFQVLSNYNYWSSTEYSNNTVWYQYIPNPYDTNPPLNAKTILNNVRAVRKY